MPSIAQLVERWTVEELTAIHRSLVQIRFEGNIFNDSWMQIIIFFKDSYLLGLVFVILKIK